VHTCNRSSKIRHRVSFKCTSVTAHAHLQIVGACEHTKLINTRLSLQWHVYKHWSQHPTWDCDSWCHRSTHLVPWLPKGLGPALPPGLSLVGPIISCLRSLLCGMLATLLTNALLEFWSPIYYSVMTQNCEQFPF
jgi:hypothetical protein